MPSVMAKRTKSNGQIRTERRSKRSKPRVQRSANRRSSRTKPVDVNAQSLSVADAGARLGLSDSTIKRMCRGGQLAWFRTRGPNGHIRVLAESVEKFRQPRDNPSAASSRLVGGKREGLEALRAEIEERRLKRELSKLDAEDSEMECRRVAAAQAEEFERERATEEVRRQAAHDAAERRARESERQEAEERREWAGGWVAWALNTVPQGASQEIVLDVHQRVEEVLSRLSPECSQGLVQRLVVAAVEDALKPWRREQEVERAVQESRTALPVPLRRFLEPSEWECRAMKAARAAISRLPSDAAFEEMRAEALQAGRQVADDYQAEQSRCQAERERHGRQVADDYRAEQSRCQAERERQHREATKKFLVQLGVMHVSSYLSKLRWEDEVFEEDMARQPELENEVRAALQARLTGKEAFEDVQRITREIVDAAVRL
jgi:hypothetical protein